MRTLRKACVIKIRLICLLHQICTLRYEYYIFISQQVGLSKGTACSCVSHAINHQWGFGCKALQRFKLLPSHNSFILLNSITCHLNRQRTHYERQFLMQAYTYIYTCIHTTCTHKRRRTHLPTARDNTIGLMVARCCCNLWWYRVTGLATHQCLPTRW